MALLQVQTFSAMTVARLTARTLDEFNTEAVGEELSAVADQLGGRNLHLDLGEVHLLTSTGLAKLLCLHRQVRTLGGQLSLCNVHPEVYEVFVVTCLTGILDVHLSAQVPVTALG
jgi:anti-anti-sigma factor